MGIQNNLKICACGSARVSQLCSSANKVQLTLLRLGNLVLDFLDFFSQLLNTSEEQIFLKKIFIIQFWSDCRIPSPPNPLLGKILLQSQRTYAECLKLSE